jgi:acyl-CoA thioester hydrolase
MEHHRKLIFSNRMPIRWGDQDAMGHVNNTVYFRYMEQARIEWLESFGYGTALTLTEGPVIVNASCTFLIPFTYPGTIDCRMFCGHPGRSSVPTYYEMRLVGDETASTPRARPNWSGSIPDRQVDCAARQPARQLPLKEIVMSTNTAPIWQPSAQRIAATRLTAFMKAAGKRWNRRLAGADYSACMPGR